jgi:transposase
VTYLKEYLVPKLKRGDVVMMDSLPVHRVAAVRQVIETAGAKLRYLPKYSPDLNPIDHSGQTKSPRDGGKQTRERPTGGAVHG